MPENAYSDLHFSLHGFGPRLRDYAPPGLKIDPNGAWDLEYEIVVDNADAAGPRNMVGGTLRLRRRPEPQGFALHVVQTSLISPKYVQQTTAQLHCQADAAATLRSWTLDSITLDSKRQPVEGTQYEESAAMKNGRIEVEGGRTVAQPTAATVTSNWSLLEAAQRLGAALAAPLEFDMLEDLEALRPAQRLVAAGTTALPSNGSACTLRGFLQTGQGVLPLHCWLNEQGLLLIAASGTRAFLLKGAAPRAAASQG
ncbi:MAG: hypothetical protein NTW86_28290 [Candidatus Sumerlaeota bacterium]|nr:hypothetical protein [Candidatus Sumerlaeota bacterium]